MIGERRKALWLFRSGKTTLEVAHRLNVPERVAERWISEQRSAELGLPSPYDRPARMSA
jgi:transposase